MEALALVIWITFYPAMQIFANHISDKEWNNRTGRERSRGEILIRAVIQSILWGAGLLWLSSMI